MSKIKEKYKGNGGSSVQGPAHWDVWVVPEKFNLLDWYWLLEDEEEDFAGIQVTADVTSHLFRECTRVDVKQSLILYVTERCKDDLLEIFQFVEMQTDCREPSYEDRIKTIDAFEPAPLQPDNLAPGWTQEWAPCDVPARITLSEATDGQLSSQLATVMPSEVASELAGIRIDSTSRKSSIKSKKKTWIAVGHSKKPKLYEIPPLAFKSRGKAVKGAESKTSKRLIKKKTSEFIAESLERRKESVVPEHDKLKTLPSFRMTSTPEVKMSVTSNLAQGPWQSRRISLMLDPLKAPPGVKVFDHLEPSNFPTPRTKPIFVIKDLDIAKDVVKVQGMRPRGPVLVRKETEVATTSEPAVSAPPIVTTGGGNVLVMPELLGLINLSPGVSIQPEGRQPRLVTPEKVISSLERQFDESTLKVLKQEKAHPKIMVWQLLERPTARTVGRPDFK